MTNVYITDEKYNRVSLALTELGVNMTGVCAREAYKLLRLHIKYGLSKEQLNTLAMGDSNFHDILGPESYRGTDKFSLR